jgi:3-(3-hydroxy-phenyl)propionate hydroxylase
MDDALGPDAWLIARHPPAAPLPEGVELVDLASPPLAPFRAALEAWLDERGGAAAVLVRPDRYVFGAGEPAALIAAWAMALNPLRQAA